MNIEHSKHALSCADSQDIIGKLGSKLLQEKANFLMSTPHLRALKREETKKVKAEQRKDICAGAAAASAFVRGNDEVGPKPK